MSTDHKGNSVAPLFEDYTISREKSGQTEVRTYVRATRESLHDAIEDAAKMGLYPFVDPRKPMTGFHFRIKTKEKRYIKVRIAGRTFTCLTFKWFMETAEASRKYKDRFGDDDV